MKRFAIGLAVFAISSKAMAQEPPPSPDPATPPAEQPAQPAPVEVPPPPTPPAPPSQPEPLPPEEGQPPPSIIIDAKDDRGKPVSAVTVFVDDKPVAYEADGKAIVLVPGPHTVAVQRNDGSRLRVSVPVNLGVGQTNQHVQVALTGHAPENEERARMLRPDPPILPRVIVGLGLLSMVAGSIVVLARPALPANCTGSNGCVRTDGMTDEQFAHTQSKMQSHDDVSHAGTALIAGGGAATAIGLLWYFIELPPIRQDARISPWMTATSGGLSLQTPF